MSTYRTEKEEAVREILAALTKKGWDIDLAFIDWDKTIDQIIKHETLDYSEADGSPESIMLADLRGVLRAVYLNGEKVFQMGDLEREEEIRRAILKLANRGDSQISYHTSKKDDAPRKLSKHQVQRDDMITDRNQLRVDQWLMIYLDGAPTLLVQVTRIAEKFFTFDEYRDKFRCGSGIGNLSELGILPYSPGLWETTCWAEEVDASTN